MTTAAAANDDGEKAPPLEILSIWQRLAAPVDPRAIAWRQDGKPVNRDGRFFARFVCYIEANTVRERLDSVAPGWSLALHPLPQLEIVGAGGVVQQSDPDTAYALRAELTVAGVRREDIGHGKDWKQASTDAFKRVAVRFGIGHELYDMQQNWVEVDGEGKYAKPVEDPQQAYERRHGAGRAMLGAPGAAERSGYDGGSSNGAAAGAPLVDVDAVSCPKCGGRMWDNRTTKRNPKAPDYKCRDSKCDGVVWPPKGEKKEEPKQLDALEGQGKADQPARGRRSSSSSAKPATGGGPGLENIPALQDEDDDLPF